MRSEKTTPQPYVASGGLRWLQSGLAQGYVASMLAGTAAILWYLLK